MPRYQLPEPQATLEKQIIETLRAGYDKPESYSDWQGAVRALLRMYKVERIPLVLDTNIDPC